MTTHYELLISTEESAKRQYAVDFARGSVRLEGVVLSSEIEEINQQYIHGHLTSDERITLSFAASEREFGVPK
jgi:Antitoxin VbhA